MLNGLYPYSLLLLLLIPLLFRMKYDGRKSVSKEKLLIIVQQHPGGLMVIERYGYAILGAQNIYQYTLDGVLFTTSTHEDISLPGNIRTVDLRAG